MLLAKVKPVRSEEQSGAVRAIAAVVLRQQFSAETRAFGICVVLIGSAVLRTLQMRNGYATFGMKGKRENDGNERRCVPAVIGKCRINWKRQVCKLCCFGAMNGEDIVSARASTCYIHSQPAQIPTYFLLFEVSTQLTKAILPTAEEAFARSSSEQTTRRLVDTDLTVQSVDRGYNWRNPVI